MTLLRGSLEVGLAPGVGAPMAGRPPTTPSPLRPTAPPRPAGAAPIGPIGPRGAPPTEPGIGAVLLGTPPTMPRPTGPFPGPEAGPGIEARPTGPRGPVALPIGPAAPVPGPVLTAPCPMRPSGPLGPDPAARPCAIGGTLPAGMPPGPPTGRPAAPRKAGGTVLGAVGGTGPAWPTGPPVTGGAAPVFGRTASCGGSVPTLLISVPTGCFGRDESSDVSLPRVGSAPAPAALTPETGAPCGVVRTSPRTAAFCPPRGSKGASGIGSGTPTSGIFGNTASSAAAIFPCDTR